MRQVSPATCEGRVRRDVVGGGGGEGGDDVEVRKGGGMGRWGGEGNATPVVACVARVSR